MANNEVVLPEFGAEPLAYSYGNLIEYSSGLKIPSAGAGKAMAREILELRKQLDAQWISVDKGEPTGEVCIVTNGEWQTVAHWNGFKKFWQRGISQLDWNPTHWRPLLPMPSTTEGR